MATPAGAPTGRLVSAGGYWARVPLGGHVAHKINVIPPASAGRLYFVLTASMSRQGVSFRDSSVEFR